VLLLKKQLSLEKKYTNLGASPRLASAIHSGLVLNWFPFSHNFKNGWKIIDQTKQAFPAMEKWVNHQ